MHPESRLWIGDLWRVLVPWTCLIDAFQQVGVESVKLLNTFLFLARGLHPEDLREPAKVFHHFLFLLSALLHNLRIQRTSLRHKLIQEFEIFTLNLSLTVPVSVGLHFGGPWVPRRHLGCIWLSRRLACNWACLIFFHSMIDPLWWRLTVPTPRRCSHNP